MTPEELKQRIRGPVYPMVIPFDGDGNVDRDALASYTDRLVDDGASILLLTVGTSRFNLLTAEEMRITNRTVAQAANGRAAVIAAGPGPGSGSTRENILFAQHAQSAGADGILLMYPERWYGDEAVVSFFAEVAVETGLGLLIHSVAMRDGFGGVHDKRLFDAALIEKVVEAVPAVVGVKEENGDRSVFEQIVARLNDRVPIIGAGGAMRRFIGDRELGSYTYLVGVGSLRPRLSEAFYSAVMASDLETADEIAARSEDVFFPVAMSYGWHRSLKAALSVLDMMPPHERHPMTALDPEEVAHIRNTVGSFLEIPETTRG